MTDIKVPGVPGVSKAYVDDTVNAAAAGQDVSSTGTPEFAGLTIGGETVEEVMAPVTNPLVLSQAINMTAATTGSNGIKVLNDADINFGTGDFTLVWEGTSPYLNGTGTQTTQFLNQYVGVNSLSLRVYGGRLQLYLRNNSINVFTTIRSELLTTLGVTTTDIISFCATVKRENEITDGVVKYYLNGKLITEGSIPAMTPTSLSYNTYLSICGYGPTRYASTTKQAILYNRALDADDVANLYKNGIDPADMWGSQTALTSGTLEIGKNYIIDTFETGDDFTNVGAASNADSVEFKATGNTPTTWANSSSLRKTGATAAYLPENIQPVPGQWLDAAHGNHALMPAEGCTLIRPENDFEIRWTNTWAGTSEMQYIGGTNQAILPEGNIRIEYITLTCTATGVDITIGDGSDADYFVTATALADYLDISSPTKRNHDGTNRDVTITPSGAFTGSITTTIVGKILD